MEYFAAGPRADPVAPTIEDVANVLVPTIVLVEGCRRIMQQRGEDEALQVAAVLHQSQVVALDSGIALSAEPLGVSQKVPLADSIIFAKAKQYGATIWTLDADFSALPGVRYFPRRK